MTSARTHVDDPVGALDDVEIVLDDDEGIALISKPVKDFEERGDVRKMKSGGGFIEEVDSLAGCRFPQLGRELDPLRLAARESRGGLSEADVAEADITQGP